jgi:dihydrofolate reductase
MSKVIYITSMSLDGYVEDESGAFDWVNPEQVHEFVAELVRPMETYLYGRRIYETMAYFGTQPVESCPLEHRGWSTSRDRCTARPLPAVRSATEN